MRRSIFRQAAGLAVLGIILLFPHVAVGQAPASGLTVTGFGEASAPAETATVQFVVGMGSYGPPQAPDPDATPGAQERESVAPIISSLTDADVSEDDIEAIVGPYISESYGVGGPSIALFRIELGDPAPERITEVVDAAIVGAAQERLIVSGVQVTYGIADCSELERQARESAIVDARDRAAVQAELLEVTLGSLHSARDASYSIESAVGIYGQSPSAFGCVPFDDIDAGYVPYGPSSFDPTAEPEVTAYAQVEMTFEITANGEATPAS